MEDADIGLARKLVGITKLHQIDEFLPTGEGRQTERPRSRNTLGTQQMARRRIGRPHQAARVQHQNSVGQGLNHQFIDLSLHPFGPLTALCQQFDIGKSDRNLVGKKCNGETSCPRQGRLQKMGGRVGRNRHGHPGSVGKQKNRHRCGAAQSE